MNKQQKKEHYNRILRNAQEMQAVAMQNYSLAAQLESEAKSALEELGANPARPQRGKKSILTPEFRLQLQAGLTRKPRK